MATQKFNLKQYDLLPNLRLTLLDGTTPVDLTLASEARLLLKNRTGLLVDAVMDIADQEDEDLVGVVEYEWQEGDTSTLGTLQGEVQVLWPGQIPQTFPAKGYFAVIVNRDLGPTTGPGSPEEESS